MRIGRGLPRLLLLFSLDVGEDNDLSGLDDVVRTKRRDGVFFFEAGAFDFGP